MLSAGSPGSDHAMQVKPRKNGVRAGMSAPSDGKGAPLSSISPSSGVTRTDGAPVPGKAYDDVRVPGSD